MAVAATGQLNLQELPSCGSRNADCFQKLEQIGEGTYAQVYKAKEVQTGEIVALKKIRMENEKEGFPITAIREIKILQKLHHKNVVKLKEIVASPGPEKDEQGKPGGIYMVFEYMDHDLAGLTRCAATFTVPQIKCYMKQLLTGLHYCHLNQVLHRDIKGANLLLDNEGNLKLADFGLARFFAKEHNANLTNRVITLWYRPPELLLGSTKYGPAVDIWSVGCIFAELLDGKPLFPGKDESEQISKIFELCGAPDESNWPGVTMLPWYTNFKPNRPLKRRLREHFRLLENDALELLEKMLVLDPAQRISTQDALDAEYFWSDPLPCDPKSLPKYDSSHEFQTKQKRQQQRHYEGAAKRPKLQHPPAPRPFPVQQNGQAHAQRQARPNQQQMQYEEAAQHQKLQHPPAHTRLLPNQQNAQTHAQRQAGPNQRKRRYEEAPEHQKLQHPPAHTRPLPFQQAHTQSQALPNQQKRQHEEAPEHQKLQHPPAHTRPLPIQQSGQAHTESQSGPNQQKRQHEEALEHQKLEHPPSHTRPFSIQQSGQAHTQSQAGPNQRKRQHEEAAEHQKLQHPPAHTRPLPIQQSGQAHNQSQTRPNQQKRQHEEAPEHQKLQHPPAHTPLLPIEQSVQVHAQRHAGPDQQRRQHEEAAKHQTLQHFPAHTRPMPNQQSGHFHSQRQAGPNQHGFQSPVPSGSGHHHGYPQGPLRYARSGNSSGGRNRHNHGSQDSGRGYGQHGSSGMRTMGPRGGGSSGSEGVRNYQQGGFYDGSGADRGSNMMGRRHNHLYGSR